VIDVEADVVDVEKKCSWRLPRPRSAAADAIIVLVSLQREKFTGD